MTTIRVPTDQADIAAAFAAAVAGDTILLEKIGSPFSGANNRGLTLNKKVAIVGETGNPEEIIVDCGNLARFAQPTANQCRFDSFTIKNGQQTTGGGILIGATALLQSILNMIFDTCKATAGNGGGVANNTATPGTNAINNCIFHACTAVGNGGGLYQSGAFSQNIDNLFNACTATGYGGGMCCLAGGGALTVNKFYNLTFRNCSAANGGGFGEQLSEVPVYYFVDCIFWGNTSTALGKQIFLHAGSAGADFQYCLCPQGVNDISGTVNIGAAHLNTDPFFCSPLAPLAWQVAFLSQIASGQLVNSNCFDSGSVPSSGTGMDFRTTRTDGQTDIDQLDRGYHYYTNQAPMRPACINNLCQLSEVDGPDLGYPEFAGLLSGTIQGSKTPQSKNTSRSGLS